MAAAPGPVLVLGAGAVGCYVGGCLQTAGAAVHFVGRPRVLDVLREHGLTLTNLDGGRSTLAPAALQLHTQPLALPGALVLLCVKSGATAEAARSLAAVAPSSVLLSLQNGIGNAPAAMAAAPGLTVLPGMVGFNVAELAPGHFHRGTTGELAAQTHALLQAWQPTFAAAGLPLQLHADLQAVQWAKLLLNLNNPVNALSGLPLRAQLLDREHRRVLAALQSEALRVLSAAHIRPARLTPLPPRWLPALLKLPNALFERIAAKMLRIDASARSSMADDVARGRPTEVDALCGEVVRLARAHGLQAPLNERISQLLQHDPQARSGAQLRTDLGL